MTEIQNGMSQNQEVSNSQISSSVAEPAPAVSRTAPTEERSFRQSEVNDIVKRAKSDAIETYKRVQIEQPEYAQQKYGADFKPSTVNSQNFNEEVYRKIAAEEAQRHLDSIRQDALQKNQDEMAKRTVQNFFAKTSKGREKYEDFDAVTGDVDLSKFPSVVQLLGEVIENSDDVFYELSKDRIKMSQLEYLAERSPNDAIAAAKKLSKSIKDNYDASKVRLPNEPLSQMRPSNTGTGNGVLSVKDYRSKYRV